MNLQNLYDAVGRENLVKLGISQATLTNSKRNGKLPATWFDGVERLCSSMGVDCPRDLFTFKKSSKTKVS